MARDADGTLIDPYGGAADLARRVLRHVGPAFVEDPLRVLRVARFAARLGFAVAPETDALMRALSASGELETLAPERVWQELARALMETHPSRFFESLHRCGALAQVLPEVDTLLSGEVRGAGGRIMRALERSAAAEDALAVRYAILAGNLDAKSPARGVRLAERLSARLRAPAECRDLAMLTAKHLRRIERAATLSAVALLDLLLAADALRRPSRLDQLLRVCAAFASVRREGVDAACAPAERLRAALELVRGVNAAALARGVKASEMPRRLRALRLKALRNALAPRKPRQK
jgi:tRNA nucleotidyltransferase (CCA-adding enzyme)